MTNRTLWNACLFLAVVVTFMPVSARADILVPFEVRLQVTDGYLAVDPSQSTLTFSGFMAAAFEECNLSPQRVKDELVKYLNGQLRKRGSVLEQRISPTAKSKLKALVRSDAATAKLSRLTASWPIANDALREWVKSNQNDRDLLPSQDSGLDGIFEVVLKEMALNDGPLILPKLSDDDLAKNFRMGRVPLTLAAPITTQKIRPTKNIDEWAKLRNNLAEDILGKLQCQLWYRDTVVGQISDYLEMRGISVDDTYRHKDKVSGLEKPEPIDRAGVDAEKPHFTESAIATTRVIVAPDPLLAGVLVNVSPDDPATIQRLLYLVLPSDDFSKIKQRLPEYLCLLDAPTKLVYLRLREGPGVDLRFGHMYLTRRFLAERLRFLEVQGFTASPTLPENDENPANRRKFIHLLVAPKGTSPPLAARPASNPLQIPDCVAPQQSRDTKAPSIEYDRGRDAVRPETFTNEKSRQDTMARRPTYEPERPHQLRLGIEQTATKPLRYVISYTQVGLAGNDALSGQVGFQDEPSGDLQYSRDFVAFDTFGRRLQLSLRAFSDFTPDRHLSSGDSNERRTGGEARGTLDVWRDFHEHSAQLDAGASWRESKTDHDGRNVSRTRIALFDAGLLYLRSWEGRPSAARLEVEPVLTLGHSDGQDGWFFKPSLVAHHHQFVGAFVQWDARGRVVTSSGPTPEVELPSFGGDSSVRGYKPDAALGKTAWALQNELWFPIRINLRLPEDIGKFLRRNVAVAAFGDVGGVHDSTSRFPGLKGGVGIGLRLVWQDYLTFRLDWAHAVGDQHHAGGGGMLYFTVTTSRGL